MSNLRVLELGSYIAPAYAGMVLAEQGHQVTKWFSPKDPVFELNRSDELWTWLNEGKTLVQCHAREVVTEAHNFNVIIDNFRPQTLADWNIDPQRVANEYGLVWVSLRADVGDRSLDMVAQARSWMEYSPWVPFYVGDTAAGLWLAFKAVACDRPGHYTLGQASCLQKLVEGELMMDVSRHPRDTPEGHEKQHPLDPDTYYFDGVQTRIQYRGRVIREPVRDREWKLANLWHDNGRIRI